MKVLQLENEIIKDLSQNKSTNDIESLYEIQKIKDSKEQIKIYFDFISKKLDRIALRAYNKKSKVSHAKLYQILNNSKTIKINIDIKDLSREKSLRMLNDMEVILEGYLNAKKRL